MAATRAARPSYQRHKPGENVDADMTDARRGQRTAEAAKPQHNMTHHGIRPYNAAMKEVSKNDLKAAEENQSAEQKSDDGDFE